VLRLPRQCCCSTHLTATCSVSLLLLLLLLLQDVIWWVLYKAEAVLLGSRLRKAALAEVRNI
jgi:hypothetical protein